MLKVAQNKYTTRKGSACGISSKGVVKPTRIRSRLRVGYVAYYCRPRGLLRKSGSVARPLRWWCWGLVREASATIFITTDMNFLVGCKVVSSTFGLQMWHRFIETIISSASIHASLRMSRNFRLSF